MVFPKALLPGHRRLGFLTFSRAPLSPGGRSRRACFALFFLASFVAIPQALAAGGGKAAGAAKFVGLAELPGAAAAGAATPAVGEAEPILGDSLVADAAKPSVPIYDSPGAAKVSRNMQNPTREGVLLIFGVIEQQGSWLKVRLPMRPNGSTGWVRTSDVKIRTISSRIFVDLSDFRLKAYRGTELLLDVPVGVGKPQSPTPLGTAYVDISVPLKPTTGPYGAYMLSVAAYSEVLTNFGGGVGQIAIHGTANLPSVGVRSSNGCLRLSNQDVLKLKDIAPTGTPVEIRA